MLGLLMGLFEYNVCAVFFCFFFPPVGTTHHKLERKKGVGGCLTFLENLLHLTDKLEGRNIVTRARKLVQTNQCIIAEMPVS